MADKRKEVRQVLEASLLTAKSLIGKGLISYGPGISIMKCIAGICRRFDSDEYMKKTPSGTDIDEIDNMLLPLGSRLEEAGRKGYRNTCLNILRMLISGAGGGHRILTPEEQKNRVEEMLRRNGKVRLWQEAVDTSEKLDQQLILLDDLLRKDRILRRKNADYQERADRIRTLNPEAMEDIEYYFDPADMCEDAVIYLDLLTSLNSIKEELELDEKHIAACHNMIDQFKSELDHILSRIGGLDSDTDAEPNNEPGTDSDESGTDSDVESYSMSDFKEGSDMPVDGDVFDLIDYQYNSLEELFSSDAMHEMTTNAFDEYHRMGLDQKLMDRGL